MRSSGKKGKKNKGTVVPFQSFFLNDDVPSGTTQVAKHIRNVAGDDSDDCDKILTVVCQLPTAPRASRISDDNYIPQKLPFIAYVTNLPFDVKEDDIYEYFNDYHIKSVRLPREDGDTGRNRGFGYVEFGSRDGLIQSLGILDPTLKGRRIRIDLFNENEQSLRQRPTRRGFDAGSSNAEGKESTNWRRDNNQKKDFGSERTFNRDEKFTSDDCNSPGSWRSKDSDGLILTPSIEQASQKDKQVYQVKKRSCERPKLILTPRTLPMPELDVPPQIFLESKSNDRNSLKFTSTSIENVFGSAKPVDTSARDLEIEERLDDIRRQENVREQTKKTAYDLNELKLVNNKNVTSISQSWRRNNEKEDIHNKQEPKNFKIDKHCDSSGNNRKKYEKNYGSDNGMIADGRQNFVIKNNREYKIDKKKYNYQHQSEHVALTSNKYSGLDEVSD